MALRNKIIISLGGNAIVRRGERGTVEEQLRNADAACAAIAGLASSGASVVITHGNGPIVGNIFIQNEAARDEVPPMPLYVLDADSEGSVGFMIQQSLYNRLHRIHRIKDIVTVVTQVVVDPKDPAFANPTKPVGPFYTAEEAKRLSRLKGWTMKEDSLRGHRRVVPSPRPKKVIEANIINMLSEAGVLVIAAGGGGVPVAEAADGTLSGVDAVIDKDLATSLLAIETGAERFIDLTQVDMVYLDYGKPGQRGIPEMSAAEAREYFRRGEFAPGSMGPKIEAAIEFLEAGGKEVLITAPELVEEALGGKAGTRIYP